MAKRSPSPSIPTAYWQANLETTGGSLARDVVHRLQHRAAQDRAWT